MAKHNAKKKKEEIVVDKKFFMSVVKKLDATAQTLENMKAMRDVDEQIKMFESKEPNMTEILNHPRMVQPKPKFEIVIDFPSSFTMQMVKEKGYQFHKELERLISAYQITSIKITTR